ncbi:mandelate racemase/muconate lactonizing enzyme family protein [Microvirga antarctica]|uniref:mandelate racemase/muconate lactonizing enzyme family protein n=1 Tax=Microvirga antarctica TaxID=2819233 RepID=UPI001B30E462|nr:mandelate racemase/muconate lactonizing enzyme family protein [Microvirga antarctica]
MAIVKIADIKAVCIRCPVASDRQAASDYGKLDEVSTVIVRVTTSEGIVGYGETRSSTGSQNTNDGILSLINREFAPLLVGLDPLGISAVWELLYNGPRSLYAARTGRTFPVLNRRGLAIAAISAIDIALWDILGKHLNVPVYQLLGGRTKLSLPLYASGGWGPVDSIGDELLSYRSELGVSAVKMRVGARDGAVRVSIARIEAARRVLGDDVDIMVDAHGTYSLAEAKLFCSNARALQLRWFEEPLSGENKQDYQELRSTALVAIAAGENDFTRFDFVPYLSPKLLDVFQPDLGVCGGITEAMRIGALAGAHQIELVPHVWAGPVLLAASAHFALACPQVPILEYPAAANPLLAGLALDPWEVTAGNLIVPDRPGLGVDINEVCASAFAL